MPTLIAISPPRENENTDKNAIGPETENVNRRQRLAANSPRHSSSEMKRKSRFTDHFGHLDPGTNNDDSLRKRDLKVKARVPPYPWKTRRPVLAVDRLPRSLKFPLREDSDLSSKIRTANLSTYRAWCDSGILIIPDSLCLARATVAHDVQFVAFFSKPHRSSDQFA
jgi:hypothetical protein